MAYHTTGFEAALAHAAGDDFALREDLKQAFVQSASAHHDLLRRARCDANWAMAAERLGKLAASFHPLGRGTARRANAEEARAGAPGEPTVISRIESVIAALN